MKLLLTKLTKLNIDNIDIDIDIDNIDIEY